MKKRAFAVLLLICFAVAFAMPVFAEPELTEFIPDYAPDADSFGEEIPTEAEIVLFAADGSEYTASNRTMPLFVDEAQLLTQEQAQQVEALLEQYSEDAQADIVIVAVPSTNGIDPQDYADDFYDYNNYGYGENRDGLLFLLAMDTRDWWISTTGSVQELLFDGDIQTLFDSVSEDLSYDDYYEAFCAFGANADAMITFEPSNGDPYTDPAVPRVRKAFSVKRLIVALAFGFVVSYLIMKGTAGSLRSVELKRDAYNYVSKDNLVVRSAGENFLYANVARSAIPKNNNLNRTSGGTHSVHVGSSGTSHGGGGGHF